MGKNFFRAVEDFFRQAGEARDLYAVTFVGAARDNFAQKNDLLIPFAYGDIQITNPFAILREFDQLMLMRGKQTARFDLIVKKLGHAPRDREAVESGCAAADLVKNHQ